ncbi:MAG: hypothetical protein FWD86_01940 [Firmicutes bacterium]|nr:hypothetical protein [Bacillota bacterium]
MKIVDLNTPHLIKNGRIRGEKSSGQTKKRIAVLLAILLALSTILSGWILIFRPFGHKLNSANFYILTLGTATSLSAATDLAASVSDGGGAGYIINDGEFIITAAVYLNKNDADTIKNRFSDEWDTQVLHLSINRSRFRLHQPGTADNTLSGSTPSGNTSGQSVRQLQKQIAQSLNFPLEVLNSILSEITLLDTLSMTESGVIAQLSAKLEDTKTQKQTLTQIIIANPDLAITSRLSDFYLNFLEQLKITLSIYNTSGTLSHRLRYFAIGQIVEYYALRASVDRLS